MEADDSGTEPVHVINIDIIDNHEDATLGAFLLCDLMTLVMFIQMCFHFKFQNKHVLWFYTVLLFFFTNPVSFTSTAVFCKRVPQLYQNFQKFRWMLNR